MCTLICARLLQSVHVTETSTDKVPNASPTAGSASSDLYGAAILDACRQLNERLAPVREKLEPGASMHDIAGAAWFDRIDLCAHGFYRTPDVTGDGRPPPPVAAAPSPEHVFLHPLSSIVLLQLSHACALM